MILVDDPPKIAGRYTCHVFKNNAVQFLERHYEKSLHKDFIY